ncbi:MAG: beta strand repeat-containing protein, partial [Candidatus Binatia bacterium]
MLKSARHTLWISIVCLFATLALANLATAANGVFLSNDTAESEVTYVVQFEATVKGHIKKIVIALPPGTNAANAALGRLIIGDEVFEDDDGEDKKDVTLSVDPSDPDTLIVDLKDKEKVKVGEKILVELFNLNNPVAGDHAIDVTTLDKNGNVLDMVMLAYSIFATGAGDITAVNAGAGLTGGGDSGDVTLDVDTTVIQRRVTGTCPAGSSIREIDGTGNVVCETDSDSGGDVTAVTAGTGLQGGGTTGDVSLSVADSFQLPQTCFNGQVAEWDAATSTWVCASDDNGGGTVTSVDTGAGLTGGPITTTGTISVATGGITSALIQDDAVGLDDLAPNSVDSSKIADGTVTAADLSFDPFSDLNCVNCVSDAEVEDNLTIGPGGSVADGALSANVSLLGQSIESSEIAANAVTSGKIADGSVGNADLAVNSVGSGNLVDGSVSTVDIGDGAVNSVKIADGTVGLLDLAANSVDSGKIVDGSIGVADVDTGQIQQRVTGQCPAGESIRIVNANGTVVCEVDDVGAGGGVTAVTASAPLVSSGGTTPNISLPEVTIQSSNTAIGQSALSSNTTGAWNTAIGRSALLSNTTGGSNTASGANALISNTTGLWNTAIGRSALLSNTTGGSNTASGVEALRSNTTGSANTASGVEALRSNTTGENNTAIGRSALISNTTGNSNTASGVNALYSNTTGVWKTAIGRSALLSNTTGGRNTASGVEALLSNT